MPGYPIMKKLHIFQPILILFQLFFAGYLWAGEAISISGFVSQSYVKSTENNYFADTLDGSFEFNEIGLNFIANVSNELHISTQFFARDFGNYNNDEILVNFAYGDYKINDSLGLRAGKMKITYGLYNEIRDMDQLRANIFYPSSVYHESWRDMLASIIGFGFYGNIRIGTLGKLSYVFQGGGINFSEDNSAMTLLKEQIPMYIPVPGISTELSNTKNDEFYAGSIFWKSPFNLTGLKIGLSFYDSYLTVDADINFLPEILTLSSKQDSYTASIEYSMYNYTFACELNLMTFDISLGPSSIPEFTTLAYYASISYGVNEMVEVYLAYSEYYRDKDNQSGSNDLEQQDFQQWTKEFIACVRFDINSSWILKLETHFNNGVNTLLNVDQKSTPVYLDTNVPQYPYKEDWMLFVAKVTYSF